MNIQNWKIFNKGGSQLNWTSDPLLPLTFISPTGKNAQGYLITDPSGFIIDTKMTDGGFLYDNNDTDVYYSYNGISTPVSLDVSILYKDINIFSTLYDISTNGNLKITKSISGLLLDDVSLNNTFIYPAQTFASAIFLNPISVGLIETEHLFFLEETSTGLYRPYDVNNSKLIFQFEGDDNEISFFNINEDNVEITWSDTLVYDVSIMSIDTPLQLNIGFKSNFEGVFERKLRIYHLVGQLLYLLGEIIVNAEAIGEDERFRTHLYNFGLPDPKNMKDIFKETDINEDLEDWEILNYKSKHMILEHDKIMPYIGTYKGLINAIKWLGYDDVFIREWFLNVKDNTKLSFIVSFDAADRTQTMLMFNADQRKTFKKLNQLSLNYCITRDSGEVDIWGTPITENCYSYNLKEVFIKLLGLKQWLEKNIIGINCRITDITGEGVYYERIQNLIYQTDTLGFEYGVEQSLSPYSIDEKTELITGDASVKLTFRELEKTPLDHLTYKFMDMAESAWNPTEASCYFNNDGSVNFNLISLNDPSYLQDPSHYLLLGATFQYPFINISDIQWRMSVEKQFAGVLDNTLVSNPLFVLENDLRYYNILDSSSIFYCVSTGLTLLLETAYLRDPSIDEWENSIKYKIYIDENDSSLHDYIMEDVCTGSKSYFNGYAAFTSNSSSLLEYAIDSNYKVPLLSFQYFNIIDASGININFGDKKYYLDIIDGKIQMNAGYPEDKNEHVTMFLNWHYQEDDYSDLLSEPDEEPLPSDASTTGEQTITINVVYDSPRMDLWMTDPSVYYWADPSIHSGTPDPSVMIVDNSIYQMNVNHIGDYHIELFAWDSYNTMLHNEASDLHNVYIKYPTIYTLTDSSCETICSSIYMSVNDISILLNKEKYPLYDRHIPLQNLRIEYDNENNPYVLVPSITYFQDVPEPNSINRFYNMTERVLSINNNDIIIDEDSQHFYKGDNVILVKFDKEKYDLVKEASAYVIDASEADMCTINKITLDNIPSDFIIEPSTDIYILNDTYRETIPLSKVSNNPVYVVDISNYIFEENQMVGIIITDSCMGYSWGGSYRVMNVNGVTHTFDNAIPNFMYNNPVRYNIQFKHAFSTYSDMSIPTYSATEIAASGGNYFKIYLDNSYCQEHYLDDTFIYVNILFDQDIVNEQWYDASSNQNVNAGNHIFYYHTNPIIIDVSTLIILKSKYNDNPDVSSYFDEDYLINQKNIWQINNHDTSTIIFKVFNDSVPYFFDKKGTYDVQCTSYDSYGNAITKIYEGLIEVVEPSILLSSHPILQDWVLDEVYDIKPPIIY